MSFPHLITADCLVGLAEVTYSKELLPELMLRLVLHSTQGRTKREFRTGKGTNLPGFDGEVTAEIGSEYVPEGHSIWEVSTEKDVPGKASEDFRKRAQTGGAESTYVGVSLRRFPGKDHWLSQLPSNSFRSVQFYDADSLYCWLLQCPAVHYWLTAERAPDVVEIEPLEHWWAGWSRSTTPHFEDDWLLAGREHQRQEVLGNLSVPGRACLQAETEEEALAFLLGTLASDSSDDIARLRQSAMVVHSASGVRYLANAHKGFVIVPLCDLSDADIGNASQHHLVLLPQRQAANATVLLPRIDRYALADVLQKSGIGFELAHECAVLARRGLQLMRERLGTLNRPFTTRGDSNADIRLLTTALLANQWDNSSPFDHEFLQHLAGVDYAQLQDWVASQPNHADSLIRRTGEIYYLTDTPKACRQFSESMSSEVIRRFEEFAGMVLGDYDSSYELEPGKRWMANIYEKGSRASYYLKEGVARTLGILATHELTLPASAQGAAVADRVVREMLHGSAPERWYSLAGQLPLLAEASPRAFLDALETDLAKEAPAIVRGLDSKGSDGFRDGVRSHDLLWALERLAWSRDYLLRTAKLLAKLDQLGFGTPGNNPLDSLRKVFVPWHPCTNASVEDRLQVIDCIRNEFPETGWKLLVSQLPEYEASAAPTSRTHLRSWADGLPTRPQFGELQRIGLESLERGISDCGSNIERWSQLADVILPMNKGWNVILLQALVKAIGDMSDGQRQELWGYLRAKWHHYVEVSDTQWALDSEALALLEGLLDRLQPLDACLSKAWLFVHFATLPKPRSPQHNYELQQQEIDNMRRAVVTEVFEAEGMDGVHRLVTSVVAPWFVGKAVADLGIWDDTGDTELLAEHLECGTEKVVHFALGYAERRLQLNGVDWLTTKVAEGQSRFTPKQRARLYLLAPNEVAVLNAVDREESDVNTEFWGAYPAYMIPSGEPSRTIVAKRLLEAGRAASIVDAFANMTYGNGDGPPPALALEALEDLQANASAQLEAIREVSHDLEVLFSHLASLPDVDIDRLAGLEWFFWPAMSMLRPPVALGRVLASNPNQLVELIRAVYRRDDGEPETEREGSASMARTARDVLHNIRHVPGLQPDGTLDSKVLRDYVDRARHLAASPEVARRTMTDHCLGETLARAPADVDGSWPHPVVRAIIEEIGSDNMDQGFYI